jgi:hypothetical protein
VDFLRRVWQNGFAMQKIERWRIEELTLVLKEMVSLLKRGENREWANVFEHFLLEAEGILLRDAFNLEEFKRLVQNILCCYLEGDSFRSLEIEEGRKDALQDLNQKLNRLKGRLYYLLTDLQSRFVEYIH